MGGRQSFFSFITTPLYTPIVGAVCKEERTDILFTFPRWCIIKYTPVPTTTYPATGLPSDTPQTGGAYCKQQVSNRHASPYSYNKLAPVYAG